MAALLCGTTQIRDVIEKKYAPLYDGHTPTPPAPRGKGHHD